MDNLQTIGLPAIPEPDNPASPQLSPLFLYIPISRLVLLSILSLGMYEAYWIYKNWRFIKERDPLYSFILPFWRGFFGYFYCHSLLRRIHDDSVAHSLLKPTFAPRILATGWIILMVLSNIMSRFPDITVAAMSGFLPSFLCLVPVQNYINKVTLMRNKEEHYYRWSKGHVFCLIVGCFFWLGILLELTSVTSN